MGLAGGFGVLLARRGGHLTYSEDLQHPLWQQRRLRVLDAANWTCVRCGCFTRQLHCHHKAYIPGRKPWDYPDELLECLCNGCHDKAHVQLKRLELTVAKHPTSALPALTKLIEKVAGVMSATDPQQRADARNALQDELDAIEDFKRGAGEIAAQPLETIA